MSPMRILVEKKRLTHDIIFSWKTPWQKWSIPTKRQTGCCCWQAIYQLRPRLSLYQVHLKIYIDIHLLCKIKKIKSIIVNHQLCRLCWKISCWTMRNGDIVRNEQLLSRRHSLDYASHSTPDQGFVENHDFTSLLGFKRCMLFLVSSIQTLCHKKLSLSIYKNSVINRQETLICGCCKKIL